MCGIAGYQMHPGQLLPDSVLDGFAETLRHRGPDGEGRYVADGTGLVQTRLAIIDLNTGDQPLYGPDGTALVANGEIYNYLELREEFAGAPFVTHSDCEVPLFAYKRGGERFADDLRGMYGVALCDDRSGSLFLSRDPFGIKPLYYAELENGLVFSSEIQALLNSGLVKREVRPDRANELLQLQFTTGRQTIINGVCRVLPGETLKIEGGRVVGREISPALPNGPSIAASEDEALELLNHALMDSVCVHQRADVPYGMFFSGGVDSSALLACMARLNDRPVLAFTAGFPGTEVHDERAHAEKVAKAVGAHHVEIGITEEDFWAEFPRIVAALDDPAIDYAAIPTYMLGQLAAKEVKVVLCGEGGDELFAGYGRYRYQGLPRLLGGRKMYRRGALEGFGVLRSDKKNWRDGIARAENNGMGHGWSRLQKAQAVDVAEWLPNDLLIKLDRCLMAHSVEGRTPLLDRVISDIAFRLPDRLKLRGRSGKYLLRRWLKKALPEAEPFTRKRGFTVPVTDWIASRARELGPLVARSEGVAQLCFSDEVRRLFESLARGKSRRVGKACFHLLFYALWHRIHIEGRSPLGDISTFLEETN